MNATHTPSEISGTLRQNGTRGDLSAAVRAFTGPLHPPLHETAQVRLTEAAQMKAQATPFPSWNPQPQAGAESPGCQPQSSDGEPEPGECEATSMQAEAVSMLDERLSQKCEAVSQQCEAISQKCEAVSKKREAVSKKREAISILDEAVSFSGQVEPVGPENWHFS